MEPFEDEGRLQDKEAGDGPSRSAQALARTRAILDARRERVAIRLRHPAFRDADAENLLREASEIAIAAELAMEEVPEARPPPVARPRSASYSLPAAPALPDRAPERDIPLAPVTPALPVSEADLAGLVLSSRWDERAPPGFVRRVADRLASGIARVDLPRVGLLAALLILAGGAVYIGLGAVQPAEDPPPVAANPPEAMVLRPTRVRTVRIPVRPEPVAVAAGDLDLRGAIAGFAEVVPGTPAEACAALVEAGWSTDGWGGSPMGETGECLAERRYGGDGATNSFAVLRGGHTLAELRIKLNLGDPATREQAGRDAGHLVAALFAAWRWDGGPALADRIAALEPFEETLNGTAVRLTREFGDVERLNLLLRFPQPRKAPGAELARAQASSLAALSVIAATHLGGVEIPAEPEPARP